jgi:hypothetical protein
MRKMESRAKCKRATVDITVKKLFDIPVTSRDVTYQTLPRRELFMYDVIIPAQGEFGK